MIYQGQPKEIPEGMMGIVCRVPGQTITWFLLKVIRKTRKDKNILLRAVKEYKTLADLPWEKGDERFGPTIKNGEQWVFFQEAGGPPIPMAIEADDITTLKQFEELLEKVVDETTLVGIENLVLKRKLSLR